LGTSEIVVKTYENLSHHGNANYAIPQVAGYAPIWIFSTVKSGTASPAIITLIGHYQYAFCYNGDTNGMMIRLPLTNTWNARVIYAKDQ
jgi:hypothetical protein